MAAIPSLKQLRERYSKEQLTIIGVSEDLDLKTLKKAVVAYKMNWIHVYDEGEILASKYSVANYPTYILMDSKGNILFRSSGGNDKLKMGEVIEEKLRIRAKN